MATKGKPAAKVQEDPEERLESAIGRTESFIIEKGKTILTIILLVVVVIGGYMGYKHWYQAGRTEKAAGMMFVAQQNFAEQMYDVALEGDGNNAGFLEVISNYRSTPQGNIANHYAGMCYAHLGDYESALSYLAKYKATKGVPNGIVNAQNLGLQGDMYVQLGDYNNAADMYRKAVKAGNDIFSSPAYLRKLGLVCLELGDNAGAEAAFQQILDQWPASRETMEAEKYLGAASVE